MMVWPYQVLKNSKVNMRMGSCSFKMPPDLAHGAGLHQNDSYYRSPRVKKGRPEEIREKCHIMGPAEKMAKKDPRSPIELDFK